MIGEIIRHQYRYSAWATERLLTGVERLTEEQFNAPGHAGHGSIRDTLIHMLRAEQGWFRWFRSEVSGDDMSDGPLASQGVQNIVDVRQAWAEVSRDTQATIREMSEDQFSQIVLFEDPPDPSRHVPIWKLIAHVANHATQHRSEVAAMLSEHGCSPGYLDMLWFVENSPPATASEHATKEED